MWPSSSTDDCTCSRNVINRKRSRSWRSAAAAAATTVVAAAALLSNGDGEGGIGIARGIHVNAFVHPSLPSPTGMLSTSRSHSHSHSHSHRGGLFMTVSSVSLSSSGSNNGRRQRSKRDNIKKSASTKSNNSQNIRYPKPLTLDEENRLLSLATEYRRLRNLEHDLALSSPTKQLPLLSQRVAAAGYDTNEHGMRRYEHVMSHGQRAREELVTRNMGLVHHVVQSILGPDSGSDNNSSRRLNSLTYDDLLQEGTIGLTRAIDRYSPETATQHKSRFATYATYWIRASVLRGIAERDDLIRVPEYVTRGVRRLSKAAKKLGMDLDEESVLDAHVALLQSSTSAGGNGASKKPRTSEVAWRQAERAKLLAETAGLSPRQMDDAVKHRRRRKMGGYSSLESWQSRREMQASSRQAPQRSANTVAGGGASASAASLAATGATSAPAAVTPDGHITDDASEIRRILSEHLKPQEMEALSWRYGLNTQTSSDQQAAAEPIQQKRQFKQAKKAASASVRDYEEEALEGLFGADGILASYSTVSEAEQGDAVSKVKARKSSRRATAPVVASKKAAAASSSPSVSSATDIPKGGRWGEAMSFAEVGRNMAVSAEYGRRLCSRALQKLQDAAADGRLELQPDWLSV